MRSPLARLFVTLNNLQYGACLAHCSQPNCSSKCNLFAITNLAINETQHQYSDRKFSVFFIFSRDETFCKYIYISLKRIVFWSATTGVWHHLPVSVSENISHGGRRGSGFEFEYTRRHKRRVFIFTKLHAKSTNARGEYFGIKYCQTVPFPPSN